MKLVHANPKDFLLLRAAETYDRWLAQARHDMAEALNKNRPDALAYVSSRMPCDLGDYYRVLFILLNSGVPMDDHDIANSTPNRMIFNRSADRLRHGRRLLQARGVIVKAGRVSTATATANSWKVADAYKHI